MLHIQPVKFQLSFNIQTNMLNIDVRHEINQLHLEYGCYKDTKQMQCH